MKLDAWSRETSSPNIVDDMISSGRRRTTEAALKTRQAPIKAALAREMPRSESQAPLLQCTYKKCIPLTPASMQINLSIKENARSYKCVQWPSPLHSPSPEKGFPSIKNPRVSFSLPSSEESVPISMSVAGLCARDILWMLFFYPRV